jgi:hypothetical protein
MYAHNAQRSKPFKGHHLRVRLIRENHQPRIKDDLLDRVGYRPRIGQGKGDVPEIGYGSQRRR